MNEMTALRRRVTRKGSETFFGNCIRPLFYLFYLFYRWFIQALQIPPAEVVVSVRSGG
jgi:hypothetical protein